MTYHICREKYRLELHWESLEYLNDSTVKLIGAKFSGPVLKNALKLESSDSIQLDFTSQLLVLMDSFYIAKLEWKTCKYSSGGSIYLGDVTLSNDFLNRLPKLEKGDYIVINTEKHEEATHAFHLVYESSVVRGDGSAYNYRNT